MRSAKRLPMIMTGSGGAKKRRCAIISTRGRGGADAILVCNYDKNGIAGYVGANTLLEMGLAFHLRKPIYLLNAIPEVSYKEEILGMQPIVIDGDLERIV